jgi:PTS system mannose-specific IIA component
MVNMWPFRAVHQSAREEFWMIGLVLVTHGRLADEFKAALEHVMGPQKQIESITIGAEDDADLCRSDIIEAVKRVDSGDGVAISPTCSAARRRTSRFRA